MALDAGAWALGFIFAPSIRRVTALQARGLMMEAAASADNIVDALRAEREAMDRARPYPPLAVGVFGDVTADEVAMTVERVGLDAVQLHGADGPAPAEVKKVLAGWRPPLRLCGARRFGTLRPPVVESGPLIIRAVGVDVDEVDPAGLRARIARLGAGADLILLDTRVKGKLGGTGSALPWEVAREALADVPFLVAGGIGPGNVREALERSGAWGVDVSSGVESAPGVKDPRMVRELMAVVNDARLRMREPEMLQDEREEGLSR